MMLVGEIGASIEITLDDKIVIPLQLIWDKDKGMTIDFNAIRILSPVLMTEIRVATITEYNRLLNLRARKTIPEGPVKHLNSFRRKH